MWIHIVLFILTFGFLILYRAGWIHLEALKDTSSRRLFVTVALCGNLLGLAFTLMGNGENIHTRGLRLEKETTGMYEEEFQVSVAGEKEESVRIQVPGKEEEEADMEPEEEERETEEERYRKELQEMVEQYNQSRQDPDYYYLPSQWNGKTLEWRLPEDHSGAFLASMSFFAAFVVLMKKTREKQEKEVKRTEQLLMDYPSMVMKFALLIQAGMTARKAFQKMAADYRARTPDAGRFAYEAIAAACYEMDSGIAEMEAYRRFGERCGQMKYKTFSTLLIQNLQKGTRCMADILEKEALEAWDERKRKARILGETAATKLLFPMLLMLAVVMAVIMIPAFLSFYG